MSPQINSNMSSSLTPNMAAASISNTLIGPGTAFEMDELLLECLDQPIDGIGSEEDWFGNVNLDIGGPIFTSVASGSSGEDSAGGLGTLDFLDSMGSSVSLAQSGGFLDLDLDLGTSLTNLNQGSSSSSSNNISSGGVGKCRAELDFELELSSILSASQAQSSEQQQRADQQSHIQQQQMNQQLQLQQKKQQVQKQLQQQQQMHQLQIQQQQQPSLNPVEDKLQSTLNPQNQIKPKEQSSHQRIHHRISTESIITSPAFLKDSGSSPHSSKTGNSAGTQSTDSPQISADDVIPIQLRTEGGVRFQCPYEGCFNSKFYINY